MTTPTLPTLPSSTQLNEYEGELLNLFRDIDGLVHVITKEKVVGRERLNMIDVLRDRINRAKQILWGYRVEVRFLDLGEDTEIKDRVERWEKTINQFCVDVEFLEKDTLTRPVCITTENGTLDQMLALGNSIQLEDVKVATDMITKTEEAKQVGVNTLVVLGKQHDQLTTTSEAVVNTDSELKIIGREIRIVAKRLMSDTIIRCVVLVILCVLVATIITLEL